MQTFEVPARDARERVERACARTGLACAALALLIGIVGFVGWMIGSVPLTRVDGNYPPFKPTTALVVILLALGIGAQSYERAPRAVRVAGRIAAGAACLAGGLFLLEYLVPVDLGIDGLLYPDRTCAREPLCGRPSVNSAASAVVLGLAVLLLDARAEIARKASSVLTCLVLLNGLCAIAGYVYEAPPFYGVPGLLPMASLSIHAATSFTFLSVGLLWARPRAGPIAIVVHEGLAGTVARRFLGAGLFAPIVGLAFMTGQRAGFYSPETSAVLMAVTAMTVSLLLVLSSARLVGSVERKLEKSEQRYRDLVEHAADAILIADVRTTRYLDANSAACRMFGYTREELLEHKVADFLPPEEIPRIGAAQERMLSGEAVVEEWKVRCKDGHIIQVESSTKLLPDGRWQGLIRDVTERKRNEAALAVALAREADARANLQALVDQMPAGVVVADANGLVTTENRFMDLLSPEAASDWGLATGERVSRTDHPLLVALRTRETSTQELCVELQDGRKLPMLVCAGPVIDANDRLVGAVATLQDISALKELERLREEWMSVVAHDLRQPLGSLALQAELLARQQLPQGAGQSVERVRKATKRLDRMVRDLTDVSRLEARRLTLERKPVDLRAIVSEVTGHFSAERRERPLHLRETGQPRTMSLDEVRMEQIVGNLLSNAIKYGTPGSPIEVTLDWREDAVELGVENEGQALSADDAERVFNRFTRSRSAREAGVAGLGLGLYICRGLVEAHGGRIWVESNREGHTTFRVLLPYIAGAPCVEPDPVLVEDAPSILSSSPAESGTDARSEEEDRCGVVDP
ncbi:sensor histidine kinase [Labilithrix luteola]|nr:PAS domain S-box protein [Labilithrix luteola]